MLEEDPETLAMGFTLKRDYYQHTGEEAKMDILNLLIFRCRSVARDNCIPQMYVFRQSQKNWFFPSSPKFREQFLSYIDIRYSSQKPNVHSETNKQKKCHLNQKFNSTTYCLNHLCSTGSLQQKPSQIVVYVTEGEQE